MQDQRLLNWLFPSQSHQQAGGFFGGLGSLFNFDQGPPGPGPGAHGPPPPGPPPGHSPWGGPGPIGDQPGPPPGPPPGSPPPSATGVEPGVGVFAVDPGAFYRCRNRYTYVRLVDGRRFWFWPVYIGRRSVAGYRWRPRQYRWVYMGIDAERISFFQCN